jgi:cell division transport system ATP-binding protein
MNLVPGEFCFITGRTGSGKSSFIQALYGSCPLVADEAFVLGTDITQLDRKTLPFYRRKLGIVFQEMYLFDDKTVFDNLDVALECIEWNNPAERKQRIEEVLVQTGLDNLSESTPESLSGGQRQTLAMARAILNKPALILADESTGNLDKETSDHLMQLLCDLAQEYKASVIMATHDEELIRRYPARVIHCKDGSFRESHH